MPKKYIVVVKSIGRKWFIFILVIIAIIALVNLEAAMWVTVIAIALLFASYIPSMLFTRKITKVMKGYYMVEEDTIAKELKLPLRRTKEKLFTLSQKQKRRKWLIIFLNKRYIFFHQDTIYKFKDMYTKGYSDKEILENLKENDLRTKAEVKAIFDTLKKHNRLGEREISVKERQDKLQFT